MYKTKFELDAKSNSLSCFIFIKRKVIVVLRLVPGKKLKKYLKVVHRKTDFTRFSSSNLPLVLNICCCIKNVKLIIR